MSMNTSPNTELISKLQAKAPTIVPGKVLVAHYRLHPNSSDLNTATIKHQYYDPDVYDEYVREESREGGKQNNFVRMGLKTEVLYNPERDENGKPTNIPAKGGAVEALVEANGGNAKTAQQLEDERLATEKALTAQKEAEAKIQAEKEAAEAKENAKKLKDSKPIREITVNDIVFEVFQNSAKTLYTAKQKDSDNPLTAEGKTLKELNENLQTVTNI